jgi:hypothetical protein
MGEMYTKFRQESLKKRDHLEDLDIDLMILKSIWKKNQDWRMVWIYLAQDWDQWRAPVNMK